MATSGSKFIGDYQLGSVLGSGAFGKVYKATKNGSDFAVKKIDVQWDTKHWITKEVKCHLRLSHENVVKYYDDFYIDNAVWIVMELCKEGDLNSYLLQNIPGHNTLIDFTKQVCCGVDYLHSQNVIHRDIKPDNIMMCTGLSGSLYTLKLADFGLDGVWDDFNYKMFKSPSDRSGYDLRGPQYYSAPEIADGYITMKSDIFSLGCLILAMFARTTVKWINDKQLVAPYIGTDQLPIADATEEWIGDKPLLSPYWRIPVGLGKLQIADATEEWISDKQLVTPYIENDQLQIADATKEKKRIYIQQVVKLHWGGDERKLQELVFSMVQEKWRDRPYANAIEAGITSLRVAP